MYLVTSARYVFADAGFAGMPVDWTQRVLHIVRKASGQIGFAVIERRWVVERSLAWPASHRRLVRGSAAIRQQRFILPHPILRGPCFLCSIMAPLARSTWWTV
ncbi:UNVERIFIED_ORG: ABC-type phosphonate transport system ATPase subunit [Microbispora rosea subsp. rosea]